MSRFSDASEMEGMPKIINQKNIRVIDSILEPVSNKQDAYKENELRRKRIMGEADAFGKDKLAKMPTRDREQFLKHQSEMSDMLNPNGGYLPAGTALRVVPILDNRGNEIRDPTSQILKEIRNNPSPIKILHPRDESSMGKKVREMQAEMSRDRK